MNYRIICSSEVNKIETNRITTDAVMGSSWKYYIYDVIESAKIPIVFKFNLISGNTKTYITNSFIDGIWNYDDINDNTRKLIDNGTNNNTAIGFIGSNEIKISSSSNQYFYCYQSSMNDDDDVFDDIDWIDFDDLYNPISTRPDVPLCKYYIAVYALIDSFYFKCSF